MKKLLLLLILSFFSAQGFAGSCPDGKVVSYTEDDRLEKGAAMFAVTSHSEVCIDDIVVKKETPKEVL